MSYVNSSLQKSDSIQRQKALKIFNTGNNVGVLAKLEYNAVKGVVGFVPSALSSVSSGSFKPLVDQWDTLKGLAPGSQGFLDIVSPPTAQQVSQRAMAAYNVANPSLGINHTPIPPPNVPSTIAANN